MGTLTPWNANNGDKELTRKLDAITQDARIKGHQLDADAALAAHAMDRMADLHRYREALAQGDAGLNSMLISFQIGYFGRATRIVSGFDL